MCAYYAYGGAEGLPHPAEGQGRPLYVYTNTCIYRIL